MNHRFCPATADVVSHSTRQHRTLKRILDRRPAQAGSQSGDESVARAGGLDNNNIGAGIRQQLAYAAAWRNKKSSA